jgi:HTH-type transcriptional regulator/antitoxin HipB
MRLCTPRDVGAMIRDRRRALRLRQSDLAERIAVSRLWINQVERGKPGASLGLVLRAFTAVGIELSATTKLRHIETGMPDINAIVRAARRKAP